MIPNEDRLRGRYDRLQNQPPSKEVQDYVRCVEANLEAERQRKLAENDDFIERLFGLR